MTRRWKLFFAVAALTAVADQISKYWARNSLPVDEYGRSLPVTVIENFWDWQLGWNTGSAFGLFSSVSGARILLTLVAVIALVAIVWMVKQSHESQRRLHWAFALVAGGAVGNIIDRIYFGKVTDFVVWKYYEHRWPTFNVADVALCVGVGLMLLDFGRQPKDLEGADTGEPAAPPKNRGGKRRKR